MENITDQSNEHEILQRILAEFERIAPQIIKHSVESLSSNHPEIDYYDADFYMEKLESSFYDVDETILRKLVFENIDAINEIFLKNYRGVKKN